LFPGALFYLNDVLSGSFNVVSNSTANSYTIYVKFNDRIAREGDVDSMFGDASSPGRDTKRYTPPSASEVNAEIAAIIASRPRIGNVSTSFETKQVFSEEHLNVALRGGASYNGFDMDASFDFDSQSSENLHIGQLFQRYYAVTVDSTELDNGAGGWFADPEEARKISAEQAKRGPLVFIETVVYGRALYFFSQNKKSDLEVKAALKAAYENAAGRANVDAQAAMKKTFASDELRYISIGGGGADGVVDSLEEFVALAKREVPPDGLGAPIAYVLRFVDDKSLAMVNVNTTYPQRSCVKLNNKVRFNIKGASVEQTNDAGGGIEIQAQAMVMAEHDTYPNNDGNAVVVVAPPQLLTLGTSAEGGEIQLGGPGETTWINRYLDFEIPDDPYTTEVNEALTARIDVRWLFNFEIDVTKRDNMPGKNADDNFRALSLSTFRRGRGEDTDIGSYPAFHFVGDGNSMKLHYELSPVE